MPAIVFFLGKIIGGTLGILIGPFGIVLGLILGHLVDSIVFSQFRHSNIQLFFVPPQNNAKLDRSVVFCATAVYLVLLEEQFTGSHEDILDKILEEQCRKRLQSYIDVLKEFRKKGSYEDQGGHGIGKSVATFLNEDSIIQYHKDAVAEWQLTRYFDRLFQLCRYDDAGLSVKRRKFIIRLASFMGQEDILLELNRHRFLNRQACELLGISRTASMEDVKKRYRRLATQFHPDTSGELTEEQQKQSSEAFINIRDAYDDLMAQLKYK